MTNQKQNVFVDAPRGREVVAKLCRAVTVPSFLAAFIALLKVLLPFSVKYEVVFFILISGSGSLCSKNQHNSKMVSSSK